MVEAQQWQSEYLIENMHVSDFHYRPYHATVQIPDVQHNQTTQWIVSVTITRSGGRYCQHKLLHTHGSAGSISAVSQSATLLYRCQINALREQGYRHIRAIFGSISIHVQHHPVKLIDVGLSWSAMADVER